MARDNGIVVISLKTKGLCAIEIPRLRLSIKVESEYGHIGMSRIRPSAESVKICTGIKGQQGLPQFVVDLFELRRIFEWLYEGLYRRSSGYLAKEERTTNGSLC